MKRLRWKTSSMMYNEIKPIARVYSVIYFASTTTVQDKLINSMCLLPVAKHNYMQKVISFKGVCIWNYVSQFIDYDRSFISYKISICNYIVSDVEILVYVRESLSWCVDIRWQSSLLTWMAVAYLFHLYTMKLSLCLSEFCVAYIIL